jgi:hypothetical protein
MASLWDFSRTDSPSPTFDEMSKKYFELLREQSGEGVVTRQQAKTQAQEALPSSSDQSVKNEITSRPNSSASNEINVKSPSPVHSTSSVISAHEDEADSMDSSKAPFMEETLVAENDDLKAYILKTYFKRMKNFM